TRGTEAVESRHVGGAEDDRVNGGTRGIGELPRRGEEFRGALAEGAVALLEDRKNRGHDQSTFASEVSASMRAGTAAAPSPTIRPAGGSGGSASATTVACPAAASTGTTSSGFFFAAMIPLSPGSRGVLSPLSQVSTAGSGQVATSVPPSISRSTVAEPSATSSAVIAVAHGSSSSSATIGPTCWP